MSHLWVEKVSNEEILGSQNVRLFESNVEENNWMS